MEAAKVSNFEAGAEGLGAAMQSLDRLIVQAIANADASDLAPPADAFRGLHIGANDVSRWMALPAGESPPAASTDVSAKAEVLDLAGDAPRFAWLAQTFGLTRFDLNVLVIALAPEVDLRYEGLYAYLQDDVTRRRPSVELVLKLLCPSLPEKLARRAHFAAESPLLWHRLLHVMPEPARPSASLLAQALQLDAQIADVLLGQGGLDRRLTDFCRTVAPSADGEFEPTLPMQQWDHLQSLFRTAASTARPLRLHFHGQRGSGRRRTAVALASAVGSRLLCVDLRRALHADIGGEEALRLACREAWLQGAVLYVDEADALLVDEALPQRRRMLEQLAAQAGISILAGTQPRVADAGAALGVVSVRFATPNALARSQCWRAELAREGLTAGADTLVTIGQRFRLIPGQIAEAVMSLRHDARAGDASETSVAVSLSRLGTAARQQCGHRLAALARRIEPVSRWADIVLPDDTLAQLRELCARAMHQQRVLGDWGFGRKLSQGKGINALFSGPSGTGKTMAAEIIANELGLELYKIDLAGVVSKYIGETEKNLDRVFDTAEDANAILLFDEADALFGKRSEVRDSHDRYANLEISYLLQKMEQFEGVAILTTNLRQNLDEAFVRRLAFSVHFPFPDAADRASIWRGIWPDALPLDPDIHFDRLARQFKLAGGNIKNIAVAAAFLAADDDEPVDTSHLLHAARREYQKMGQELTPAELSLADVVALEERRA